MADRYDIASLDPRELVPGHHGRFLHTEHTTQVYWQIEEGAQLPEHHHPAEQTVHMLEGTYELTVDGEYYIINATDFGVLTRMVATGELEAHGLAEQLTPYYEQVKALAAQDPRTIRAIIASEVEADRAD